MLLSRYLHAARSGPGDVAELELGNDAASFSNLLKFLTSGFGGGTGRGRGPLQEAAAAGGHPVRIKRCRCRLQAMPERASTLSLCRRRGRSTGAQPGAREQRGVGAGELHVA